MSAVNENKAHDGKEYRMAWKLWKLHTQNQTIRSILQTSLRVYAPLYIEQCRVKTLPSLMLSEEHEMKVSENKVLARIFGSTKEVERQIKYHNYEFINS
jgi:hypothetical protein